MPCRDVGLPQEFYDHASRGEVLADLGLTDQDVARRITGWVAALGDVRSQSQRSATPRLTEHLGLSVTASGLSPPRPVRGPRVLAAMAAPGRRASTRRRLRGSRLFWPPPSQSQHSRRTRSGEIRFSIGTPTRCDTSASPALAASSRAAASGLRLLHRAGGGGPLDGSATSGRSRLSRAASSAANHIAALRRWLRPPNTGNATRSSIVFGSATAASTMAVSGSTRRGAMSRRWAIAVARRPQFANRGQASPVMHPMDPRRSAPAIPPRGRRSLPGTHDP